MPESHSPLGDHGQQNEDSENLVRGAPGLGLGELGAEVEADDHADEGEAGGDGLVDPVPAHAFGVDTEEDGAEGEEEDECATEAEGVDDAGPVAVVFDFSAFGG